MPFYEYECTKCHNQVEILQRISDPPVKKCEQCNGKMKKLISNSTFHLKGSGWYVTDYKSKSGGYDGKTDSGDSAAAKDTKSGSSDASSSKPETKKSAKASDE
ncbi:FmdB family zinc ribbon protein [Thermodesulfobacteriota bacterium]